MNSSSHELRKGDILVGRLPWIARGLGGLSGSAYVEAVYKRIGRCCWAASGVPTTIIQLISTSSRIPSPLFGLTSFALQSAIASSVILLWLTDLMNPEEAVDGRTTVRIIMHYFSIQAMLWTISGYTLLLTAIIEYCIKGHQERNDIYNFAVYIFAAFAFAYLLFAIAVLTVLYRRRWVARRVSRERIADQLQAA